MERGKMSTGRGGKSKVPQHPQDIFALGSKSTVPVSRDSEKRNIHKPSTSGVGSERKRETSTFGTQPPQKRSRIGSPAESVGGTSLEVDPVDLVPNVLQALDTHNSDKLLGLLTGSIRLLKSQRSKPDPILCMSMLYLTKIRPNMFAHDTVTQSLCTLLKREQGAAFKSKGNPLVFVLACNMLYAAHRDSNSWPDTFIKVYIEDALNERWWVDCSWCKCLVENIASAFNTKQPPPHLIPTDNTLGTMSPSGSGSPLMGSTDEDIDNTELEYSVFPRYSSSYESVEALVLEAIKDQIQRRAAPDAIGKGFLKLLSATCGFPEIRMIAASRLEAWLHSGKLWRAAQELLAHVCVNADASGPTAPRDHEVLAQLARMRLKTKPLQQAYHNCLREMVSESGALLRSVVTHTIYNELSNVRSPNNMAVLGALVQAQPRAVPQAMADTYQELLLRPEDYLRPLRALTRECVRAARADASALLPLARALASPPPHEPTNEIRERAFSSLADLFCCCMLVTASHSKHLPEYRQQLCLIQDAALSWLFQTAHQIYRPPRHEFQLALNKIMFVESAETYCKPDNWPPESERALTHRLCCDIPLPQSSLVYLMYIGLSKDIPIAGAEVFELIEQLVRRACALPVEESPLQVDKLEVCDYLFQLCQFTPPDNITLPPGYTPPALAITSLYWRAWLLLTMLAAHNPSGFAERAAATYPTLRALIETCITGKPSVEWAGSGQAEAEAERQAVLTLETHLAAASNAKLPITEHNSRLLSQLTTMDPLGPARKPPPSIMEQLQQVCSSLRLGKLLCRQPALLLELVERHGTRRAMPWLHRLLQHDQLELSVLPVQCLCEFLSAGGGSGEGGALGGKAGELAAHLRRTVRDTPEGAMAVLHYYLQRLAHRHAHTRATANRGLKLVLTQHTEEVTEMDYNAEVTPDEWLELVVQLSHWEAVREAVVSSVRAACLVECVPAHLAAYIQFLASYVSAEPLADHTPTVLDLSQVIMERMSVMSCVLPALESRDHHPRQHRALYALQIILTTHIKQVRASEFIEEVEPDAAGVSEGWSGGQKVVLVWGGGRRCSLHVIIAHAHLKLLCYGPSMYDTNMEMYSFLQSLWVGTDAPTTLVDGVPDEATLLPDWLRLHLVRSARPALLEAGLRGLPAPKLALFIQTFGMPTSAMSALLRGLDACSAGAIARLGVERGYMGTLLSVQRARGATGGDAFAAALDATQPSYPPDDNLFAEESLPEERVDSWQCAGRVIPPTPESIPALLCTAFDGAAIYVGDIDLALAQLLASITEEVSREGSVATTSDRCRYTRAVLTYLGSAGVGPGLLRNPSRAAPLLRALLSARNKRIAMVANNLLKLLGGIPSPVVSVLQSLAEGEARVKSVKREPLSALVPQNPTKDDLIKVLESTTAHTLEATGHHIIEMAGQHPQLVVDVLTTLLQRHQDRNYDKPIKSEGGGKSHHVLSSAGRGCGLLLDWVSELQRETLGPHPQHQMRLMFRRGGATWRPLLVTLLAHRASWRTLHTCLAELLRPGGDWAPGCVLDFVETLMGSWRVLQGRDKTTPKHHSPEDTLRLDHYQPAASLFEFREFLSSLSSAHLAVSLVPTYTWQPLFCLPINLELEVLVGYVAAEALEAEQRGGLEAMRRCIEARLQLILRCCASPDRLLAAALAATQCPMLLLLLYMKVPKVVRLLHECESRPPPASSLSNCDENTRRAAAASTSATDSVTHASLTHLALQTYSKENQHKVHRMESSVRALWGRVLGSGRRALPLAGALLRGAGHRDKHHHHLLAALEMLPDQDLFHPDNSEEVRNIMECFVRVCENASGGGASGARDGALQHRVAALLRRYLACAPHRAAATLHAHRDTISGIPALSSLLSAEVAPPASAAPPPRALLTVQRRTSDDNDLHWALQELEAWGVRRGGAWGGAGTADAVTRAVAPLVASTQTNVRDAALSLLARLLPAAQDSKPGVDAVLSCLESPVPEVAASVVDKLPDLVVGMQEHAALVLSRVVALGLASRLPVETCLARCVAAINLNRGC